MKVKSLNGRVSSIRIEDYLIDWRPAREVSAPQAEVKRFLYPYWKGHVCTEETPIKARAGCRPIRADLMNWTRRILVEVSPQSSHSFNAFFHRSRVGFSSAVKRDLDKEAWAVANGFQFVELSEEDIAQLSPAFFLKHYDLTL